MDRGDHVDAETFQWLEPLCRECIEQLHDHLARIIGRLGWSLFHDDEMMPYGRDGNLAFSRCEVMALAGLNEFGRGLAQCLIIRYVARILYRQYQVVYAGKSCEPLPKITKSLLNIRYHERERKKRRLYIIECWKERRRERNQCREDGD